MKTPDFTALPRLALASIFASEAKTVPEL
jgi:hypothetical protein